MPTEEVILNVHGDRGEQNAPNPNHQTEYAEYQAAENLRTRFLHAARDMFSAGRQPAQLILGQLEFALLHKHGRPLELTTTEEGTFFLGLPVHRDIAAQRFEVK